ncbi:MAG: serine/threonine-protein kinase [Cyanobacteria bacterium P01_F01_bin.33]
MVTAKPQGDNRYATLIDSQRYTIVKRLTGGGMSDVYVARDLKFSGRQVAIKMLKHSLVDNPELQKRLKQEIAVCAALENEHVVQVSDYGVTAAGHPYCVMEFLEGETLGTLLGSEGRLAPERAIQIATQVCVGLQAAHRGVILKPNRSRKRVRIVHRDLKPDNIFLVPHPVWGEMVKILDFGIAKLYWEQLTDSKATSYGFKGSLRYASPEQWAGSDRIDSRADLYSLGVVLYEMLSGTNPFGIDKARHTSLQAWLEAHTRSEPIPLDRQSGCDRLDPELIATIMRCLAKTPDERFASADELRAELVAYLPQSTHPPANSTSTQSPSTRTGSLDLPVPPHLLSQIPAVETGTASSDVTSDLISHASTSRTSSRANFSMPSMAFAASDVPTSPPTSFPKSSKVLWSLGVGTAVAAVTAATWLWGNTSVLRRATALAENNDYAAAIEVARTIPTWQRSHVAAQALLPTWHYEHALALAQSDDFQTAIGWVERYPSTEARGLVSDLTRLMVVEGALNNQQYDQVVVSANAIAPESPLYAKAQSRLCRAVAAQLAASVGAQISTSVTGSASRPSFDSYHLQGCGTNRLQLQTDIVTLNNRQPANLKLIAISMAGLMWETLPANLKTDWQQRTMEIEFRDDDRIVAIATLPNLALVPQVSVNLDGVLRTIDIQTPSQPLM